MTPLPGRLLEKMINASRRASGRSPSIHSIALKFAIPFLLGFAVLNAVQLWRARDSIVQGYGDFASFYTAGQIVRSGQSQRLYDPATQWRVQQQFASTVRIRKGPLPYIRPPFEALLFLPLAYLAYPTAYLVWMALKVIILLTLPLLLPLPVPDKGAISHAVMMLVSLSFFPVAFDLIQGQDSLLLLLILVLSLKFLLRHADLACGAVLALGMFKFHLVIPLLAIFVLRRRLKIAVGFAAVASSLFIISLGMVNWSGLLAYPRYLWELNLAPGLGMVPKQQNMPNVRGLMTILQGNAPPPAGGHWLLAAVVILGIIIGSWYWRGNDRRSILLAFSFAIVVTLVTSYYANSYDLSLLLLPLLLLGKIFLQGSEIVGWPRVLFLSAAAILLFTPLLWVVGLRLDQFGCMALVLFALALSISAAEKHWQPSSRVT
jgi:Glycosyltransferase family 87